MGDEVNANAGDVIEVNFEKAEIKWDPQDNIRTTEDIVALVTDGAPSWMTIDEYPFIKGRTDLCNFKDAVLVTAQHITEVINGEHDRRLVTGLAHDVAFVHAVHRRLRHATGAKTVAHERPWSLCRHVFAACFRIAPNESLGTARRATRQ